MLDGEKRELARVPVRLPLLLAWTDKVVEAETINCSRNGVGLQCPLERLGLPVDASVIRLARNLADLLPAHLTCTFHPDRLGTLIVREIRPMRVALEHGVTPLLEVGARLDRPLGDSDAAALGVALPRRGETLADAMRRPVQPPRVRVVQPPKPPPAPPGAAGRSLQDAGRRARRASDRLRVRATPLRMAAVGSVQGRAERIDRRGLVLRVSDRAQLKIAPWAEEIGAMLLAFCESYGARFTLDVFDGVSSRWSGPAHIRSVEILHEAPSAFLLGFEYGRPLRAEEEAALELQPA